MAGKGKTIFYKNKVDGMTDEDGNIKWPSVFSLYGTTLLGMLVTDSFVFSFQIGDGDISFVTKKKSHHWWNQKIFGNRDSFIVKTGCLEKISGIGTETRNGE